MILGKKKLRRCAIFLFFDKDGIVDDYICHMLEDLRNSVEYILVISNGYVERSGLQKLKRAADDVYCRANLGLDVGGYREGLFYIGFKKLAEYDEVVMLNYTFFGPLYPFSEMFDTMAERDVDFWGITKHHKVDPDPFGMLPYGYLPEHIQSFFMVLRPSLFLSYQYKDFIFNMQNPVSYQKSIVEYETIFTKHFEDFGFTWDVYVNTDEYERYAYCPNMFYIKEMIEKKRCPMIKRRSFFTDYSDFLLNSCGETSIDAYEYIRENLDYSEDEIWDNILRLENISDVHRDMHFNYMLPKYGNGNGRVSEGKTAVLIAVEWTGRLNWYKRFLKEIPSWADVYLLGSNRQLCEEVAQVVKSCIRNPLQKVECEIKDYLEILRTMERIGSNGYTYVGILYLQNVEKCKPYSNDVSWQFCDWENMLGSAEYVDNLLEVFQQNLRLGMMIPPVPDFGRLFADLGDGWMNRYEDTLELLKNLKIRINVRETSAPLTPIGGSFWIRSEVLKKMHEYLQMNVKTDFQTVLLALPFLVQKTGFYTGVAYSEEYASVAITNQDYMFRETNKVIFDKYGANFHNVCVQNIKNDAFV